MKKNEWEMRYKERVVERVLIMEYNWLKQNRVYRRLVEIIGWFD